MESGSGSPPKPIIGGARGVLASFTGISPPRPPSFSESPCAYDEVSLGEMDSGSSGRKRRNGDSESDAPASILSSIPALVEESSIAEIVAPYHVSEDTRASLDLPKVPVRSKNAYLFFANDNIEKVKESSPGIEMKQIAIILGEKWKVTLAAPLSSLSALFSQV
jgi:hypothetical protein